MDNKSLSHTKWKCQYHIVFIPKYRKKILYGSNSGLFHDERGSDRAGNEIK